MLGALPSELTEAIVRFSDPEVCVATVAAAKWPRGPQCPQCAGKRLSYLRTRRMWKCLGCKKQFSVKVGTIFEDSPISLDKWLYAMWIVGNCEKSVSSYEVARTLKVTQKTAWYMLHRLRYAMLRDAVGNRSTTVEAG
jgi:transposase-like protein